MNSKQVNIIIAAVAAIALIGIGYYIFTVRTQPKVRDQQNTQTPISNTMTPATQQQSTTPSTTSPSTPQTTTPVTKVDTSKWKIYKDTEHSFELKYPTNSTVEPASGSDRYIRIQNYRSDEDRIGLRSGEYYLEMFIDNSEQSCAEKVEQSRKVAINGQTGYRGLGPIGGDAGGQRFALCINNNGKHFYIVATENSDTGNIANAILDSFKFTQ